MMNTLLPIGSGAVSIDALAHVLSVMEAEMLL